MFLLLKTSYKNNMSDQIKGVIIGSAVTLFINIINIVVQIIKDKSYLKQKKMESLSNIYEQLLSIVYLYPLESPTDIQTRCIDGVRFSHENFDNVIKQLEIKEEHNNCLLEKDSKNIELINANELIKNIKDKVMQNKNQYIYAKDNYYKFCGTYKGILLLYATSEVKQSLEQWEITINNVFIAGHSAISAIENENQVNQIEFCRNNLIKAVQDNLSIK